MKLNELHNHKNIAYKIMAYDPESGQAISGADNRLSFPARPGQTIKMSGEGVYMSLNKQFVMNHYSEIFGPNEVLLTLEFDPTTLTTGNLSDRESVFTVPKATILDVQHLVHDEDMFEASDEENHKAHKDALEDTGFWGNAGAGALFMAKDSGRILFSHRSKDVEQPHTWGTWGGAIDQGEKPLEAVRREAYEEAGIDVVEDDIIPLYVFKHESGFQYFNYLILVDNEFTPKLDWETQGSRWVDFGDWPEPLHFGPVGIFKDHKSFNVIQNLASEFSTEDVTEAVTHDEALTKHIKLREKAEANLKNIDAKIWRWIKNFLSDSDGGLMWHGSMDKLLGNETAIMIDIELRSEPKNTPDNVHSDLIRAFEEANFYANRDDFFVTGDDGQAGAYGSVGAVFPMEKYKFTWSPNVTDFYSELKSNTKRWLELDPKTKQTTYDEIAKKYIDGWKKEIKGLDDDLGDAKQIDDEDGADTEGLVIDLIMATEAMIKNPKLSDSFIREYNDAIDLLYNKFDWYPESFELDYRYAVNFIRKNYRKDDLAAAIQSNNEIMLATDQVLWMNSFMAEEVITPWLYEHKKLDEVLDGLDDEWLEFVADFKIIEGK